MHPQNCFFCGHLVTLVHVHGHYQCPVCHTNALPCCDGDNCETNVLLQNTGLNKDACILVPVIQPPGKNKSIQQ